LLIRLSEEFLDSLIDSATKLAKHRGATAVEAKDVLLELGMAVLRSGFFRALIL
jgi:histone H3/H4